MKAIKSLVSVCHRMIFVFVEKPKQNLVHSKFIFITCFNFLRRKLRQLIIELDP